jgi:hypothetical protein
LQEQETQGVAREWEFMDKHNSTPHSATLSHSNIDQRWPSQSLRLESRGFVVEKEKKQKHLLSSRRTQSVEKVIANVFLRGAIFHLRQLTPQLQPIEFV